MSGYTFDANILIDALFENELARNELKRLSDEGAKLFVSRMAWIEVLSKGSDTAVRNATAFLRGFAIDEISEDIARRAAALRRERPRLKSPDAVILATAQVHGRILVTRNTRDFPANMPGIRVPYTL